MEARAIVRNVRMTPRKIKLICYLIRVFITDQIADMLPNYLRFVKGIIDTKELPLNEQIANWRIWTKSCLVWNVIPQIKMSGMLWKNFLKIF